MANIARALEAVLARPLSRTSVLLLGPRQTGKTTLLHRVAPDLTVGLAAPSVRQRYERDPGALAGEVEYNTDAFDAATVRLTGNVVGQPPFTGTLMHRGWRVTEIKLPKLAEGHDVRVLAPAEVEL